MIPSRWFVALAFSGLFMILVGPLRAEPYLAVREGLMCSACHVNNTGQGKRTLYGVEYTQTDMPIQRTRSSDMALNRALSEFLSIGADVRLVNHTSLPDVDNVPAIGNVSTRNSFMLFEANLYAEIVLKPDRLTVYVDEQVAPSGAFSREVVGMIHGLPHNGYVKVGRMILPYGLRLWDFDAYIRSQTNNLGQDFGVEFGIEPKSVSFQFAVSNGEQFSTSDSNNGKQITLRLSTVHARGRIGGSFAVNTEDPFVAPRDEVWIMGGPFIGLTGGPVTILGEYDLIRAFDTVQNDITVRQVVYGEADILLSRGVNAKVAFDYFEPDDGQDAAKRLRIGLEPTINEFLQARVFYNLNRPRRFRDPLFNATNANQDQVSLELHVMF